jgi:hypothetical protein
MQKRYFKPDEFRDLVRAKDPRASDAVVLMSYRPTVRTLGNKDSRLIEFIITDETVDWYSDVIRIDGWDTSDYEHNPVVLWAHSHYDPPVAKAVSLDVLKKKKQIRSVAEFTPQDVNPFGYLTYRMYVQRFLNAVSVGFMPKEYAFVSESTHADRARRGGIDYLKQSLLEYSAVPVPANPNALQLAKSVGIDITPMKAWAERVLDESASTAKLTGESRQRLEAVRAVSSPSGRPLLIELSDIKAKTQDEGDVVLIDGQRVPLTKDLIAKAVELFVTDELAKASGKVPEDPVLLIKEAAMLTDKTPRTLPMSDDDFTALLKKAMELTVTKAIQRVTGNADGWL